MWSSASGNSASPHCIIMKPICATVDQASEVLTAGWVSMTSPPNSAVNPPTITSTASMPGASSMTSAKRISTKPPALMTPAWSSADTGVGASITSVSQPCSGNCADFSIAATANRHAATTAAGPPSPMCAAAAIVAMSVVRYPMTRNAAAAISAASPARRGHEFLARGALRRDATGVEEQQAVKTQAGRHPRRDELDDVAGDDKQHDHRQRCAEPGHEHALPRLAGQINQRIADHDPTHE